MDSASNILLLSSFINYLSRQLRRQSVASAHQVLSGRLGLANRGTTRVALTEIYVNSRGHRRAMEGRRGKIEAEELG